MSGSCPGLRFWGWIWELGGEITPLSLVLTTLHCCWVFQRLTLRRIPRLIHTQPLDGDSSWITQSS